MSVEMVDKKKNEGQEKRYTRRLGKVGNSLSTSIPKEFADILGMDKGDEIEVTCDQERGEIIMKKVQRNNIPKNVRPEVLSAMNRAINKYDNALRNLKDR
ncbi:AbrB/MazE/SpoVT family DNA-binding domain-containing protein [Alteribacillus sp. JSM 102045]|uniref:AbrB/MazE/SpoVT family DNA-binding domain-containing protein n=1 Tax=Alteribacillus sp. JSM 102045 TaxID=1562101 RepID=UPI0035C1E97A